MACTASHAWVAPAGGTRPLLGTNPLAFGWPRPGKDPFVFDFATSAASRGDIELHRQAGRLLPDGWGIDAAGNPSTSPEQVLAGAMLPFGSSLVYAFQDDTWRNQNRWVERSRHVADSLADQASRHANFSKIESEPVLGVGPQAGQSMV